MQLFDSLTLRVQQLMMMMMMILGFLPRLRLLCLHAHMIMRLGVLVLPLLLLRLWTLLLQLFWPTWQPSRPGYPRRCSRCFRACRTGRMHFSSSYFRIGLRVGHSWPLCFSILVSQHLLASRSSGAIDFVRTPCWYLSAPAGHFGVHLSGSQLCLSAAASATSICYYHYRCGSICDRFCSGSSRSAASVRVSTSSSFYRRSWIQD
jgi:hypothetical protein